MLPFVLVFGGVCYARKEKAVGGWLLFFCGQIYLSTFASLFLLLVNYQLYLSAERLGLDRYLALLAIRLPSLATSIATAVAVTVLFADSNWESVVRLRYILIAHACSVTLALYLDLEYFPTAATERVVTMAVVGIWIAYFYGSSRVQSVFLRRDWDRAPRL